MLRSDGQKGRSYQELGKFQVDVFGCLYQRYAVPSERRRRIMGKKGPLRARLQSGPDLSRCALSARVERYLEAVWKIARVACQGGGRLIQALHVDGAELRANGPDCQEN